MTTKLSRRARIILAAVAALAACLAVAAAAFPVGLLKGAVERRLSAHFGRPVAIAGMAREEWFSFTPVVRLTGVRVPQAPWAGGGALLSARLLRVRVPVFPLIFGRFDPVILTASGVSLDLVRTADGRTNWGGAAPRKARSAGGGPRLDPGAVIDAVLRYRDARQHRAFLLSARADPDHGLIVRGRGVVDGAAVTVLARGAAVTGRSGDWPFAASIDGPQLALNATGQMAAPFAVDRMRFHLTARADDLKRIDRIVEAGLFGTQAIRVAADVRRDGALWTITGMEGTIGRSAFTGRMTVDKSGPRTQIDGEVHASVLDFDDLASDAGLARAAALERAQGLRLVPNTRINLIKIDDTDARIAFRADRILGRRPSALRTASGVFRLDHQRLVADPLRIGLARGAITGRVVVDQGGAAEPMVTLALDLAGSSIGALAGNGEVDARVDGRVRLSGRGSTIREAVGRSNGSIGLVARDGALPAAAAAMLGFDLGGALLTGDEKQATLRCAAVRLAVRGGRGVFAPLLIDTSRSQMHGDGTLAFPDERIAATLTGAPKGDAALRLRGTIHLGGTIRAPEVVIPRGTRSAGRVLGSIGRAITGQQGPRATSADCAALARQAFAG